MRGQKRVEDARRRAGVPRIHVFGGNEGVDGRDRPGHDECQMSDSQNYCVAVLIEYYCLAVLI